MKKPTESLDNADNTAPKQKRVVGRPFPKGVSGNPAGRPIGSISIMTKIKQRFAEDPDYFEEYIEGILADRMMRREIVQQLDGKPVQPIAGVDGQPIVVQVIKYNDGDSKPPIPTP